MTAPASPPAPAPAAASPTPPDPAEWEGPERIGERFDLSRSLVFELIRLGKIRSVSIKTRAGNLRGRRLVSIQSVRAYLASLEN